MPLKFENATFKSFTDFATKFSDRTIAAFGDDKNSVESTSGLNGRTIIPSRNRDFIGNVGRRAPKKEANEAVRTLFRQSIIDMFGGESMIPESVKTAMKLEDYGKGKPLSARRIRIVNDAINAVKEDMKPINIDEATAQKMIKQSETFLGGSLDDYIDADKKAAELLMKFGQGMTAKTARVLSNFIVKGILNNEDKNLTFNEETIQDVAKDMKTWDEFIFGDERLNQIGNEFMKYQNNYIKEKITDDTKFMKSNPDVFNTMNVDANRFDWTINGQKFPLGSEKQVVIDAFCNAVPNSNARKAISIIFNQAVQSDLALICNKIKDPSLKTNLCELPNANIFVSRDFEKAQTAIVKVEDCMFDLKISEDGKTATITVTTVNDLTLSTHNPQYKIGKANIAIQSTFDLTKDIPEVTNVTFSQTYSPDEIYVSPAGRK
ncbi:MAG: hypothetical protein J6W23_13055 [Victivallales bacterium]|nr:hypothetical protein [Victivallales bacterium]